MCKSTYPVYPTYKTLDMDFIFLNVNQGKLMQRILIIINYVGHGNTYLNIDFVG